MSNIFYEPSHQNESVLTGNFLYISESTYGKDWCSFPHRHFHSEVFNINKGKGHFEVEGERFAVKGGDVVIINSNLRHTEYSDALDPLDYYVVGIENISFVFRKSSNGYATLKSSELSRDITRVMTVMISEMKGQKDFYSSICKNLSDIIMLSLLRQKAVEGSEATTQNVSKECLVAKEYMDQNYAFSIDLDLLAEKSHFSKFYLSKKFSEEFGMPPMQYLTEKRLQVAEQLLSYTNLTIAQIAESIGYSSHSYFAQVYKKHNHISPIEYRKTRLGQ